MKGIDTNLIINTKNEKLKRKLQAGDMFVKDNETVIFVQLQKSLYAINLTTKRFHKDSAISYESYTAAQITQQGYVLYGFEFIPVEDIKTFQVDVELN